MSGVMGIKLEHFRDDSDITQEGSMGWYRCRVYGDAGREYVDALLTLAQPFGTKGFVHHIQVMLTPVGLGPMCPLAAGVPVQEHLGPGPPDVPCRHRHTLPLPHH